MVIFCTLDRLRTCDIIFNMNFNEKMEGPTTPGTKIQTEKFVIKSRFLNKLFWVKPDLTEIIKVIDLNSKAEREIGDEVFSSGRFLEKGVKGIIKNFKDDTCYIGVEWEDGTTSFVKDKDLMEVYGDEKLEKDFIIKKGIEVFNTVYAMALEQGDNKLARRILGFKREIGNADLKMDDLLYTIKECQKFIDKNKN